MYVNLFVITYPQVCVADVCWQGEKEQLATELVEERERAELAKQQENSVQEALDNSVAIFNKRQDDMQNEIDLLKTALADEQKRSELQLWCGCFCGSQSLW